MKSQYKVLLICIGVLLLFVIAISYERLILNSGKPMTLDALPPQDNPPVEYNAGNLHKIFKDRPTLSEQDQAAKKAVIAEKNPLKTTDEYAVEYLSAPDEFMVEIKTTNFEKVKADTVAWFESQGFSTDGICNLPVVFYLNYDVAESLRGSNTIFTPLPPGC